MDRKQEEEAMQAPALAKAGHQELFTRPVQAVRGNEERIDWLVVSGHDFEPSLLTAAKETAWTLHQVVPGHVWINGPGIPAYVDRCLNAAWLPDLGALNGHRLIEHIRAAFKGEFKVIVLTSQSLTTGFGSASLVPGVIRQGQGCVVSARGFDFMDERSLDAFRLRVMHFMMRTTSLQMHAPKPGHPCVMEPPRNDYQKLRLQWVELDRRGRPFCEKCREKIVERFRIQRL